MIFNCLLLFSLINASISKEDIEKKCSEKQLTAFNEFIKQKNLVFRPLEGGFTRAQLYRFNQEGQEFVLRFLDPKQPENFRVNEIKALKIANRLGLAPDCRYSDQNALLMVMPFIKGHTLTPQDIENPRVLNKLGHMVRTLHTYSGEDYPKRYTLLERIERHYQKAVNSQTAVPTGFDKSVKTALQTISDSFVPCHGDLHPSNILVDGNQLQMIDWTSASWDDPYTDLAYICLNMNAQQQGAFLKAYLGRCPTPKEQEKIKQAKKLVYLITAVIWFRFSETDEDQKIPYDERVARLDARLASLSPKKAEDYLREGKVVNLRSDSKEAIVDFALSFYKAYLST